LEENNINSTIGSKLSIPPSFVTFLILFENKFTPSYSEQI